MDIKDLFISVYEVISKYDLSLDYCFKVTSCYIDVISQKGVISNDVLQELVSIDAYIHVSFNENYLYVRLTPKS